MTHRIEQVNKLLRREISELIRREAKDPRLNDFVAITDVDTSGDLRHAKVFVSYIGASKDKADILQALGGASGFLRKELSNRLKLRRIPQLSFLWDDSIERGTHLLELIDKVSRGGDSNCE